MFAKGQKVTYIRRWSESDDFAFTQAVVFSCGKKQMVLTNADTGVEMGRHFNPNGVDSYTIREGEKIVLSGTYLAMTDEEATSFCNTASSVEKKASLARLIKARSEGENEYWAKRNAALQEKLEAQPNAVKV